MPATAHYPDPRLGVTRADGLAMEDPVAVVDDSVGTRRKAPNEVPHDIARYHLQAPGVFLRSPSSIRGGPLHGDEWPV